MAQCLQEIMFIRPHQRYLETLSLYRQLHITADGFGTGIEGTKELLRSAFYLKGDHIVIGHHYRPGIQVVWRYRRNNKARCLREYHRPAATK